MEDSFLERNYGPNYGKLYKPDSMSFGGGRGNGKNFNIFNPSQMQGSFDGARPDRGNFDFSQIPGMIQGESGSDSRNKSMRGDFHFNRNSMGYTTSSNSNWIWLAISVLILGASIMIVKEYKKEWQ